MIVNEETKTAEIKIVYYGCGMSGKTTSLKFLFKCLGRGDMLTSIETTQGRTLFFDFGVIPIKGGDWTIKLLVYSATGQDFYAATRLSTLMGADGIIFIVDSQRDYWEDNIRSWNELTYFFGNKIDQIPKIMCLNKRDLPNPIDKSEICEALKMDKYQNIRVFNTIATTGEGVFTSFSALMNLFFPGVTIRSQL